MDDADRQPTRGDAPPPAAPGAGAAHADEPLAAASPAREGSTTLDARRRALAFVGALVAGLFLASRAGVALGEGYPGAAAFLAVASALYVAFLASFALAPAAVGRFLAARSHVRIGERGHLLALVALATTLFAVFGLGSGLPFAIEVESSLRGEETGVMLASEAEILAALTLNLLVLTVPVILWLRYVRGRRGVEILHDLGLRSRDAAGSAALGVGVALAAILGLALLALATTRLGAEIPANERAIEIGLALSIPGAFAVAALASLSEEVFFRGFLQPRVGVLAQAILFSVAHLSYFHALQLVATFGLGLAFGYAYRATRNLGAPLAAHFAFNLLMLLAAQAAQQAA